MQDRAPFDVVRLSGAAACVKETRDRGHRGTGDSAIRCAVLAVASRRLSHYRRGRTMAWSRPCSPTPGRVRQEHDRG